MRRVAAVFMLAGGLVAMAGDGVAAADPARVEDAQIVSGPTPFPHGRTMYVAWNEIPSEFAPPRILLASSADGGLTSVQEPARTVDTR